MGLDFNNAPFQSVNSNENTIKNASNPTFGSDVKGLALIQNIQGTPVVALEEPQKEPISTSIVTMTSSSGMSMPITPSSHSLFENIYVPTLLSHYTSPFWIFQIYLSPPFLLSIFFSFYPL